MFLDEDKEHDKDLDNAESTSSGKLFDRKNIVMLFFVVALVMIAFVLNFVVKNKDNFFNKPVEEVVEEVNEIFVPRLIGGLPVNEGSEITEGDIDDRIIEVEYLSFSDYYSNPFTSFDGNLNDISLPLNVKVDVQNYYDISRKINLDPGIENLNKYGFAILENGFDDVDNFYNAYEALENKQIPALITSDFLIYYYQNVLKKSFKEIEEIVFFESLWDINKELYGIAMSNYEKRLNEIGYINNSLLEGERLTVAYFAVALELLGPTMEQIDENNTLGDKTKFSTQEAENYNVYIPSYLEDDVLEEVRLIREHKGTYKSPVLLYQNNYEKFVVPGEYNENVRLNNFYLTSKWLSSVFPLYHQGPDCPNCSLDIDDWRINMITSTIITDILSNDYSLKSKWARIYKVMYFFRGLRDDLTYVSYRDSLRDLFGQEYNLNEIFDQNSPNYADNFIKLRNRLLQYNFLETEGSFDKETERPYLGLKVLSEPYWPNEYVFKQLTYPKVQEYLGSSPDNEMSITACKLSKILERCDLIGLDFINLIHEISGNDYFDDHTNYKNYDNQISFLRSRLDSFNSWHNNYYWTTLFMAKKLIKPNKDHLPAYTKNVEWDNKGVWTALSAWVNLQLPADKLSTYGIDDSIGFDNDFFRYSENSYIEPNLDVINELIANTNMLLETFYALGINDEVNSVAIRLQSVKSNLESSRRIVEKELNSENLNEDDIQFISSFVKQFKVIEKGLKEVEIVPNRANSVTESIEGIKFMVLIHKKGDSNIFSVGPVFNYSETD